MGAKKPSMAANEPNVAVARTALKTKPKNALQKEVGKEQVKNYGQNAFITGVKNLRMGLNVSD